MTTAKNLIAGLGGAIALNLLHESLKKTTTDAPRIDKLGEEAIQKGLEAIGKPKIKNEKNLFGATLGADLASNALYYSMIGAGGPKNTWSKALGLGLAAGTGAVALPKMLGINPIPVTKNGKTKTMTVGYYLFGALVTAGILKFMDRKKYLA